MTVLADAPSARAVVDARRRHRRWQSLVLRWQARLDAEWADRVVPWGSAALLFVVYLAIGLARYERLEAATSLGRHLQAAWHIAHFEAPEVTIGGTGNLLADRLPLLFLPIALVTRVLPPVPVLLGVQSASLALGVVPLWRLARRVATMRVGAAGALILAYAAAPAVADLDLGGFHPAALAITPLLAAAYLAAQERWRGFAFWCAVAVLFSAELGLLVAGMGIVLAVEGHRRIGIRTAAAGILWTAGAVAISRGVFGGETGLVEPGAFRRYGDTSFEVLLAVARNPLRPFGDLLAQDTIEVVAWVLGPLLFLPLLVPRRLLAAAPLMAIYFIADAAVRGPDGGGRTVPLIVMSFVAATYALASLGRRSIQRVLIDRRLLLAIVGASVAALLVQSPASPYSDPWRRTPTTESAGLIRAAGALPADGAVRVPAALAPRAAERDDVRLLAPGPLDVTEATRGVDAVLVSEADLSIVERRRLRTIFNAFGFELRYRSGGAAIYERREPRTS